MKILILPLSVIAPLIFLSIVMMTSANHEHLITLSKPKSPSSYNHMQFVTTWIPTFCRFVQCRKGLNQNFMLHGLWPADVKGFTLNLTNCKDYEDPTRAINNNRKLLDLNWRSLHVNVSNEALWRHEWRVHGRCALYRLNSDGYFSVTRTINPNLLATLERAGIVPNDDVFYSRSAIENATKALVGRTNNVYISCQFSQNILYLKEIYLCLNTLAQNYVSCPFSNLTRGCGPNVDRNNIRIPLFPPNVRDHVLSASF